MRVGIFNNDVSSANIAQDFSPEKRKEAKLMVVDRRKGEIEHVSFYDIDRYFGEGDMFVFNNSYLLNGVFPLEERQGESVFFLRENRDFVWEAVFSSIKKVKQGNVFHFKELGCFAEVIETLSSRTKRIAFYEDNTCAGNLSHDEFIARIKKYGKINMKEYVGREFNSSDIENIKDVFASQFGSLIPNVAGLHFSEYLVKRMMLEGIGFSTLTYHVVDDSQVRLGAKTLDGDRILPERCFISNEDLLRVNEAYAQGKKICAVGFSVACALENLFNTSLNKIVNNDILMHFSPVVPSQFKLTSAYLTNFYKVGHLSLKVDSGFCGHQLLEKIYRAAIENGYSFSIYGDSLLVL